MVKRFVFFMAIFILFSVGYLSANSVEESEYYVKSMPVHKIYRHAKGYRVDYITSHNTLVSIWIPIEWMRQSPVPGEKTKVGISAGAKIYYPYISFFFKSGKLDYLRLYVQDRSTHDTWVTLGTLIDYSENFPSSLEEIQEIIEF